LGIELIELQNGGMNYTFDTMKQLKEMNPEVDYYFIVGADMVSYLPKWHRIDELVELVQFVGVRRLGYPEEAKYPVTWVDIPKVDFSSTRIREWIAAGNSPYYLVPELVAQYIQEKRLYLDENE
jgi:nicotinate-nucleotide adenylyltransferase